MEIGILVTLMRSGIVVSLFTIISLTWIFGSRKIKSIMIIFIIFFAGTIFVAREKIAESVLYKERLTNVNTIESRLSAYKTGINLVKNNFLFGIGYRNYTEVSLNYENRYYMVPTPVAPHNGLLLVIGQLGVFGLIIFLFIYFNIFKYLLTTRHAWYGKLYMILIISYVLMNTTSAYIDNPSVSAIHMIFISLALTKHNFNVKIFPHKIKA